jgi:hypothetical protein
MVVCVCPWLVQNVSLAKCTGPNIYWKFNGGVAVFSSNRFFYSRQDSYICVPSNSLTRQCPEWLQYTHKLPLK